MITKIHKPIFFDIELNWLQDRKGVLTATDALGVIHVATPPAFGGEGKPWTPEHLFLGAISSCFMTTYLAMAHKLKFEITHLECQAIGQVEIVEGKYRFTNINLYPKVYVSGEEIREKADLAMQKTHRHCLISNSVNADIFYHSQILIGNEEKKQPEISHFRKETLM